MDNQIIEVKISDIKIGTRFRKYMGNIEGFAQSIEETDLLHAIGITPDYELIFGERRLRAYRDVLHRDTIPTRIVKLKSVLLGQITETMMRKDFAITERLAIVDALRSFKHGGDRRLRQDRHSDDETLTLDEACKRVGLGRDSYYRAKEVEEKGIPDLIRAMDSLKLSVIAAKELAQASPDEQQECLTKRIDEGTIRNQRTIHRSSAGWPHSDHLATACRSAIRTERICAVRGTPPLPLHKHS